MLLCTVQSLQSETLQCSIRLGLLPSVLWHCWLGDRKGIRPIKIERWGAGMVICLERGADLHMAQQIPLPLTVSCFSKIQIGFTFLVPAHPGSPGQRAVKRMCVCVCVDLMKILILASFQLGHSVWWNDYEIFEIAFKVLQAEWQFHVRVFFWHRVVRAILYQYQCLYQSWIYMAYNCGASDVLC